MPCFNLKVSSRDVEDPLLLGVLFRMDKSILVSSQCDTVSFSRIFFRAFSYLSVLIIKFESTAVVAEEWKGVPNCEYSICHKCLHDFYIRDSTDFRCFVRKISRLPEVIGSTKKGGKILFLSLRVNQKGFDN